RDLEAEREWNVGLLRAIHDRLDAAGVSASHPSVGQRVQALIEERDRLKHENEMLHKDREAYHEMLERVPGMFVGPIHKRVEYLLYLVDDLRSLADKATEEEQKLRKENAD